MKTIIRVACFTIVCSILPVETGVAQSRTAGCTSENSANATQTLRCDGGLAIVAEDNARYFLRHRAGGRSVESVELDSKALLIDVPKKPGGNIFRVITPQAIAAVRGTKWAVDAAENKSSVFVVSGRVVVDRRNGVSGVTLGPGEGVDVEARGPLTVKRWPPERVSALMARLGQ
jgi:ferric-dicitrate binding protein FerR (iron transport regulator)